MKLDTVTVVPCPCGSPVCRRHGLSSGLFYQGCGWDLEEATEIAKRINAYDGLVIRIATLEQLRPIWARGWTEDSIAAQTLSAAVSELWKLLGVDNQTEAVIKLKELLNG